MPAFVKNLTFDCVDALRVARFWAAALGSDVDEDSTSERAYVEAPAWGGPNWPRPRSVCLKKRTSFCASWQRRPMNRCSGSWSERLRTTAASSSMPSSTPPSRGDGVRP
ncbi:MAG TPA: VOC family protein [Actinomycetes bacterium]|nr:VOC family protein [Actinomycetes bacterium]